MFIKSMLALAIQVFRSLIYPCAFMVAVTFNYISIEYAFE